MILVKFRETLTKPFDSEKVNNLEQCIDKYSKVVSKCSNSKAKSNINVISFVKKVSLF